MVPTEEYYPDRAYLFAFLLSARLFIKPHELLGEVCALCEHQQNLNGEGGKVSISIFNYIFNLWNDMTHFIDITRKSYTIVSSQNRASDYYSYYFIDLIHMVVSFPLDRKRETLSFFLSFVVPNVHTTRILEIIWEMINNFKYNFWN